MAEPDIPEQSECHSLRIAQEIDLPFSPLYDIDRSRTVRQTEVRILEDEDEKAREKGTAIGVIKTEREQREETGDCFPKQIRTDTSRFCSAGCFLTYISQFYIVHFAK